MSIINSTRLTKQLVVLALVLSLILSSFIVSPGVVSANEPVAENWTCWLDGFFSKHCSDGTLYLDGDQEMTYGFDIPPSGESTLYETQHNLYDFVSEHVSWGMEIGEPIYAYRYQYDTGGRCVTQHIMIWTGVRTSDTTAEGTFTWRGIFNPCEPLSDPEWWQGAPPCCETKYGPCQGMYSVYEGTWHGATAFKYTGDTEYVPEWRRDIRPGDILFDSNALGGLGHVGIYVGNGMVIEALLDNPVQLISYSVIYTTIDSWDDKPNKYVVRVNCSDAVAQAAADFCQGQLDKPYQIPLKDKDFDADQYAWYCSELVWAAYWHQGIDLEFTPDDYAVSPIEIYLDEDTVQVNMDQGVPPIVDGVPDVVTDNGGYILGLCPVDLVVTDPDGEVFNNTNFPYTGAVYMVDDVNNDGSPDNLIGISQRKVGTYLIDIVPTLDAQPNDTYTIKLRLNSEESILAENTPIVEIPNYPYSVELIGHRIIPGDLQFSLFEDQNIDVTTMPQTGRKWVLVSDLEGIPIGRILVDFDLNTADIDLTSLIGATSNSERKAFLHMPDWPEEIDVARVLYIPSTDVGQVYVLPFATSLDDLYELNPYNVPVGPGNTALGITLSMVTIDGQDYYEVAGISDGGGGEVSTPITPIPELSGIILLIIGLGALITLAFHMNRHHTMCIVAQQETSDFAG